MSTPTSLVIPRGVDARTLTTDRGDFAAHTTEPIGENRGHILLIPGFTGSKEDFTPLLAPLGAMGWAVTTYDQRGQFETNGTSTDDYSLSGFAEDALAVHRARSSRPSVVIGHSFGGLVAQEAVLRSRESWDRLGLLCSGPGALGETELRPLAAFVKAVDQMGLKKLHEMREAMAAADHPLDIARFLARRFTSNSSTSLKAIAEHLRSAPDRIDDVAVSGIDCWVARGRRDDAWPHAMQERMAERLGTEIVIIEASAHSPAIENTDGTLDALAPFLTQPVGASTTG